jgi:hypothetical protein
LDFIIGKRDSLLKEEDALNYQRMLIVIMLLPL